MSQKYTFLSKGELPEITELPDPFIKPDGTRVADAAGWEAQREYLKAMLDHYMFGETPAPPEDVRGEVLSCEQCLDGLAVRERLRLTDERGLSLEAELLRPAEPRNCPVIIYNRMSDGERCTAEEDVIKRGYAILFFNRDQLAADEMGAKEFDRAAFLKYYPEYPRARAIAIWGWGCSFCASWAEKQPWAGPLLVTGFSRGGKTALRAAAWDERFSVCLLNSSGTGGGGCLRYTGGRLGKDTVGCESVGSMTSPEKFWYWYRDEIQEFGNPAAFDSMGGETYLPFDLHTLRALVAPRAILCTEGLDDPFSNCYGTQVAWRAAQEVYDFLGCAGNNGLAYFEGGHDYFAPRWLTVLDFCDVVLYGKPQRVQYRRFAKPEKPNFAVISEVPALHFSWRAPNKV